MARRKTAAEPKPQVQSVRQYLLNLKWDGILRIDRMDNVIPRGSSPTDHRFKIHPLRALLLGAVQRAIRPGTRLNVPIVVMSGSQGLGKSQLIRTLAGDRNFEDGLYDYATKDAAQKMGRAWIVEVIPSFEFTRRESDGLKAFLEATSDTYRPPYQNEAITVPRSALPVLVTNEQPTFDSLRFIGWHIVDSIRMKEIERDRDDLWAEAVAAYTGRR